MSILPLIATDPQLGPAMALVALRTEHPELPPTRWTLAPDGHLSGTIRDEQAFLAYVEVLGVDFLLPMVWGQQLFTTWHDVRMSLAGMYIEDSAAVPAVSA
jgi:hypothetical protein